MHNGLPARPLPLRSPLQAVAARAHLGHLELSVCSIYLPPGVPFPEEDFRRLLQELPGPVLIVGDFNAHSRSWGCEHTGHRGRILESLICDESLCILNTGQRTHVTLPSGQTSALDLSLCSPQLAQLFTWSAHDDPLGSDHFPVWIECQDDLFLGHRPQKWNVRKANWVEFQSRVEALLLSRADGPVISAEDFTTITLSSADWRMTSAGSGRHLSKAVGCESYIVSQ